MSQQYPQQPYQQQPYYDWPPQPPGPPKKDNSTRNALLIVAAIVLPIAVIALAAGVSSTKPDAAKTVSSNVRPGEAVCGDDKNAPCTVRVGQAFTRGKHQTLEGWRLVSGPLDDFDILAKVKNVSDKPSGAFITFKVLRGNEVLGDILCSSGSLEPGQIATLNCLSGDDYTSKFDRVTVEATF